MEFMTGRSQTCGELTREHAGSVVRLSGWVNTVRDMGGLAFVDLRDRWGLTQLVFEPGTTPDDIVAVGQGLKSESSLTIEGEVRERSNPNPDLPTGAVEVVVAKICVHAACPPLPFEVGVDREVGLETRMSWRFLDLRRPGVRDRLPFRHQIVRAIRNHFDDNDFVDVETPVLFKSTPEGARDYLVPSRLNPGHFYALPQSPQTLKQTLMSAGLDRYYQIVKCFRDEDLRGDRQPEFTQLDMEMSFVTREDVFEQIEGCFERVFKQAMGRELATPFTRMSYDDAIARYGHDAPDTRFGCEHQVLNHVFGATDFGVMKGALEAGGDIRMMAVPGGAKLSRKELDGLTEIARDNGAGGLLWYKIADGGFTGPVAKFLSDGETSTLKEAFGLKDGDLVLGIAADAGTAAQALHKVRMAVGHKLELIDTDAFHFHWIVDFPLFEATEDGGLTYNHHPFCFPHPEDRAKFADDPLAVRAWSYDLVLNGWELGSGSIRNHEVELQQEILDRLGIDRETQETQFGFLFQALRYGAPPHGGIALGIDRIVTLLFGGHDIRESIAFPKTHKGTDLFSQCPSPVSAEQIRELGLEIRPSKG